MTEESRVSLSRETRVLEGRADGDAVWPKLGSPGALTRRDSQPGFGQRTFEPPADDQLRLFGRPADRSSRAA